MEWSTNPLQKGVLHKADENIKHYSHVTKSVKGGILTFLTFLLNPRGYTGGRSTFWALKQGETGRNREKRRNKPSKPL